MKAARALALPVGVVAVVGLAACFSAPRRPVPSHAIPPGGTPPALPVPPLSPQSVPDAVPRVEPRSAYGNPRFYEVFGRRYYVLSSSAGYVERGVASWYGPGFHKILTSTHEPYDMYGMTAAHKTLPLPAYVRVTNLQNGRSIVVRINDRGPFVGNRIIDLSYTAAAKLDMLRNGTAMVEVRSIDPAASAVATQAVRAPIDPATSAAATQAARAPIDPGARSTPGASTPITPTSASIAVKPTSPSAPDTRSAPSLAPHTAAGTALFVQAGAFADPANAERLAGRLRGGGYGRILVRDDRVAGRLLYRVRIGPVPDVTEFDRIVAALDRAGVHDAHLAMD